MRVKIALVTGGMGGIGTSVCQHLARKGIKVIATYHRNAEQAREWQNIQIESGYHIGIQFVDVNDFESCKQMVQNIESEYGAIDILVNNAGITRDVSMYKMSLAEWHAVINTNLDGVFNITRNVISGMIQRGYGRIVNVSSINGQKGQIGQTNYAASKAGILGFTRSLAQEVARKGITVNSVSPGYIWTSMIKSVKPSIQEEIKKSIPIGRFGKPEEVAEAICFLTQESSGFITGANLSINGGQYLS